MFKDNFDKKMIGWGLLILAVICVGLLFFFLLFQLEYVVSVMQMVLGIIAPILYGLVFGYLLAPALDFFESKLRGPINRFGLSEKNARRLLRFVSIFITVSLALCILGTLIKMVLPQVIVSIYGIVQSLPDNLQQLVRWINEVLAAYPAWEKPVMQILDSVTEKLNDWAGLNLIPKLTEVLAGVSVGVIGAFGVALDLIIGVIACVYVLNDKETFCAQGRKLCYGFLPKEAAQHIISGMTYTNGVFVGFIGGKLLDSLIIGMICFVCLSLMHMPYTLLVSVIVGVTNIIPFFGPFIGAIPSAFLILLEDPRYCLYFVLFIILLQQVDGNIIGPKILGDSTGISSFWVIFAILLGGGLFGFPGMVLGIPTFAVFYHYIKYLVEKQLDQKGLPVETKAYMKKGTSKKIK